MKILEKGNYRIHTITSITKDGIIEQPISYGLNIEKRCPRDLDGKPCYYVILSVEPSDDNECVVETCGARILDIEADEWFMVREMIQAAIKLVSIANIDIDGIYDCEEE